MTGINFHLPLPLCKCLNRKKYECHQEQVHMAGITFHLSLPLHKYDMKTTHGQYSMYDEMK